MKTIRNRTVKATVQCRHWQIKKYSKELKVLIDLQFSDSLFQICGYKTGLLLLHD